MFSRKYSPSFSRFVSDVTVTDTNSHQVSSLISGSDPALLTIPLAALGLDGSKIKMYLSGRAVFPPELPASYSGNLSVAIFQGQQVQGASQLVNLSGSIIVARNWPKPISLPFAVSLEATYDYNSGLLYGSYWGAVDPAKNGTLSPAGFAAPAGFDPNSANFFASYTFSVAPPAGTTVQTTEFRFGS